MARSKDGASAPDREDEVDGGSWWSRSLSSKVLILTIIAVMVAEVLIYVPAIANFRNVWLIEKIDAALLVQTAVAGRASTDADGLQEALLERIGVTLIAADMGDRREMIGRAPAPGEIAEVYDVRQVRPLDDIAETFETLLWGGGRLVRVVGEPSAGYDSIEIVLDDMALRADMLVYSRNILALSLVISAIAATLIFLALRAMLVRPMLRITRNMIAFSRNPSDPELVIEPSRRSDEIGLAEEKLAAMETALRSTLLHQRHLADLGLAVSKINHDLRNIIASAQLISDRLGTIDDPSVQRLAPKLVGALDRAVGYTRSVLAYGKASESLPERRKVALGALIDEVADGLDLPNRTTVLFENRVSSEILVDVDPDQFFRVVINLMRNAVDTLEAQSEGPGERRLWVESERKGGTTTLRICDTGPGLSDRARDTLFQAFRGSTRPGGTGLGLAIAAEIVDLHGGHLELIENYAPGACFAVSIPDRPLDLEAARSQRRPA